MKLVPVIIAILCLSYVQSEKIQVAVYYESLCPYSSAFITKQLWPVYEPLIDYIEVLFVPFGKSIITNNGATFWCQHGDQECVGNMIQSCGLYALTGDTIRQSNYIACQMARDADRTSRICAEENGMNYSSDITRCVEGGLGRLLQIEAERTTHRIRKPYPEWVPTVVFNNTFNEELRTRATQNFLNLICEMIDNAAPTCKLIPV